MASDTSPTARALQALELITNAPGITAQRLADRLGVSERAARRYVAILREAGVPVDSVRGPYGGYRVGRGMRLPPLTFTAAEALGLVMAVLEGPHVADRDDPSDPVGSALGKFIRVLPEALAAPAELVLAGSTRARDTATVTPDPETTAAVVGACSGGRRVRLGYRLVSDGPDRHREMDVDPWAVVVRRGRWFLLCWSHTRDARRVLRVDRVTWVSPLAEPFLAPPGLDPMRAVEEHLSEGWSLPVEVVVEAPVDQVAGWLSRSLGRLEAIDDDRTRLTASTDEPEWYALRLAALPVPFRVLGSPELVAAVRDLGQRLLDS